MLSKIVKIEDCSFYLEKIDENNSNSTKLSEAVVNRTSAEIRICFFNVPKQHKDNTLPCRVDIVLTQTLSIRLDSFQFEMLLKLLSNLKYTVSQFNIYKQQNTKVETNQPISSNESWSDWIIKNISIEPVV